MTELRHALCLRQTPLFANHSDEELSSALWISHIRSLERPQALFWQGEPNSDFFFLTKGFIKLTRRDLIRPGAHVGCR